MTTKGSCTNTYLHVYLTCHTMTPFPTTDFHTKPKSNSFLTRINFETPNAQDTSLPSEFFSILRPIPRQVIHKLPEATVVTGAW